MKTNMKYLKHGLTILSLLLTTTLFAQKNDCEGKFGKDSVLEVKNISMFNQYLQQKDYDAVYPYWDYLFNNIPCFSKHITYYGPTIVKVKMQNLKKENPEEYELRKEGLIDTVLLCYDKRIEFWGSEGYVLGKKARDMDKLRPNQRKAAIAVFEKSVKLQGKKSDDLIPMYFLDCVIDAHENNQYSLDSLYTLYFQMKDITGYNLENDKKNLNDWMRTDTTIDLMMNKYLTCDKITEYFKPQTDLAQDAKLLARVAQLLQSAKCINTDYYNEIAIAQYKLNPSSESAIAIARGFHTKSDYSKAKEFYLKGAEGVKDQIEKADVYFQVANIEYTNGNGSLAKKYAESALAANPNHGNAHLIIAHQYASSVQSCTADLIDGRSAYWAAVDRAIKAKTVDPSVTEKANEMINKYSAGFVTKSDAFFKGFTLEAGASYTVPCLGISTTVRYKN